MAVTEEFDPKKRLVGAGILIGLAVIILPAILDQDEDVLGDINGSAEASTMDALKQEYVSSDDEVTVFVSKIAPIEQTQPEQTSADSDNDQQAKTTSSPAPQAVAVAVTKPAAQPKPAAVKTEAKSEVDRGWVVRIGTFANADNVRKVLADLDDKGFSPEYEAVETSRGEATRIWLGPFAQRVDAARARTRLEQRTGEPGLITAYP